LYPGWMYPTNSLQGGIYRVYIPHQGTREAIYPGIPTQGG